jgi:hypothetical protein
VGPQLHPAGGRDPEEVRAGLEDRGLSFHSWSNGPGATYGWHDHDYSKTLVCLTGSPSPPGTAPTVRGSIPPLPPCTGLAFEREALQAQAKVGILAGSVVAALLGAAILSRRS